MSQRGPARKWVVVPEESPVIPEPREAPEPQPVPEKQPEREPVKT